MTITRLLAAGCSFTKDNYQKTWPDYLSYATASHLHNIGARGAGIDFIAKTVMFHSTKDHYDLVAIMLPSADRFDWYVDTGLPIKQSAVSIASWQDGQGPSLVRIDSSLSLDSGFCLSGGEMRGDKKYWYKYYYSESGATLNYWFTVYALQNFLEIKKINYVMFTAYDRDSLIEQGSNSQNNDHQHRFFYDVIDWSKFIFYQSDLGFLSFVKDHQFAVERNHPVTQAHEKWVQEIILPNLSAS